MLSHTSDVIKERKVLKGDVHHRLHTAELTLTLHFSSLPCSLMLHSTHALT